MAFLPGFAMSLSISKVPTPVNEPVKGYAPGSPERASLKARLVQMSAERIDMPLVINGKDVRTGKLAQSVMPHRHAHVLGDYHQAGTAEVQQAIAAATAAQTDWANLPWEARAAVFLKAADLLAGPYRDTSNAATMLGQSKTCHQAEIELLVAGMDTAGIPIERQIEWLKAYFKGQK